MDITGDSGDDLLHGMHEAREFIILMVFKKGTSNAACEEGAALCSINVCAAKQPCRKSVGQLDPCRVRIQANRVVRQAVCAEAKGEEGGDDFEALS